MAITVSRPVAAAPHLLFAVIADIRSRSRVITAVSRVEMLSEGPVQLGTRFREWRIVGGREHGSVFSVTAVEAPRTLTLKGERDGMEFIVAYRIEGLDVGSRLTLTFRRDRAPLAIRLRDLARALTRRGIRQDLERELADIAGAAVRSSFPRARSGNQHR